MSKLNKISEEKAHAEFSASGSSRWLNCPGSISLCKKAPPGRESEYAAEGTRAHTCLEFLLKNRKNLTAAKRTALKSYSLEMVEYALDAAYWIIEQIGDENEDVEFLCETKVDASPFTCEGQFGTLDAAIVRVFDRLTVIDYKYGAGVAVDPVYGGDLNPQLAYYALALSYEYQHNFSEVELVVIQPRAFSESGETTRSKVFPMDQLLAWEEKFRVGVERARAPLAPLASGNWCKFCPASVICPELKEKAMRDAQIVFRDNAVQALPEVKTLAIPDLGKALHAAEKLEKFIEALRDHAQHVLECGGEVPGWKLVQKRSTRKWIDEQDTAFRARTIYGSKAFTEPKLLSPAQMEKISGKDWVNEQVTNESSGTTVVPEDDKRPAVKPMEKIFLKENMI